MSVEENFVFVPFLPSLHMQLLEHSVYPQAKIKKERKTPVLKKGNELPIESLSFSIGAPE